MSQRTYQRDCARTWRRVFGKDSESELQAADLEKVPEIEQRIRALYALPPTHKASDKYKEEVPEFERKISAQYADVFREPTGLPPARKDGGFRIRTIPGAEPPHRSPCHLTPEE